VEEGRYHAEVNCAKNEEKSNLQKNVICDVENHSYRYAQCANRTAKKIDFVKIVLFVRFILRKNTKIVRRNCAIFKIIVFVRLFFCFG